MVKGASLAGGALLLLSCAEAAPESQHNPSICGIIDQRALDTPPSNFAEQHEVAIQCVDNWAARLSRSDEPVSTVVDGAIGACRETFVALEGFATEQGTNGAEVSAEIERRLREQALFRVVQWRAGNCNLNDETSAREN